jgi:hypothetical protein
LGLFKPNTPNAEIYCYLVLGQKQQKEGRA